MIGELYSVPKKQKFDKFGGFNIKFSSEVLPPSFTEQDRGSRRELQADGEEKVEELTEIEKLDKMLKETKSI